MCASQGHCVTIWSGESRIAVNLTLAAGIFLLAVVLLGIGIEVYRLRHRKRRRRQAAQAPPRRLPQPRAPYGRRIQWPARGLRRPLCRVLDLAPCRPDAHGRRDARPVAVAERVHTIADPAPPVAFAVQFRPQHGARPRRPRHAARSSSGRRSRPRTSMTAASSSPGHPLKAGWERSFPGRKRLRMGFFSLPAGPRFALRQLRAPACLVPAQLRGGE